MTTIACSADEGVMISESKTTDGDVKWKSNKIERIRGSLIGGAGDCGEIEKFMKWFRVRGRKPQLNDSFNALELSVDGLFLWDKKLSPYPPGQEFHAIGTGSKAAIAARLMGADCKRAVEIACEVDDASEGPLQIFHLKEVAS